MFSNTTYINRRQELKKKIGSGIVILPGNSEAAMNYAGNGYAFRQDSSFIYYVGLNMPDLVYLLDIDNDREYLFGDELTIDDVIWMGSLPSLKERAEKAGINTVESSTQLPKYISGALKSKRKIHYLKPYRYRNKLFLSELFGKSPQEISESFSLDMTSAVIAMRLIKSEEELRELADAGRIGYAMHIVAMKMCQPGALERDVAGTIEGLAISAGNGVSFPTILSMNGQTLHNHDHSGTLETGRLMLCDAGAENLNHYASDFTRTTAVGGKYTARQTAIHNIVLSAVNESISMARPGVTYKSVHRNAYRIIFEGLREIGLTCGNTEDALTAGAPALFMPHGLGHAIGLDVHDMENLGETSVGYDETTKRETMFGYRSLRFGKRLEPGHVLTVEPGVYFIPQLIDKWKAEGICKEFINFDRLETYRDFGGIRIEDNIAITEKGARLVYEKRLPITVEEITEVVSV
ncbi:MAG: aminopeptidase P N-terminal domain-containing protein [Dysgonamonadaceae bacterium]|jgi:Xaa-Pro aminopeptidase|nr:aminopeptidase P N-terminal domain-containing protein [Dysgonamonadaceae bacterium]